VPLLLLLLFGNLLAAQLKTASFKRQFYQSDKPIQKR